MTTKVRAAGPITALMALAFGAIGANARPVTEADALPTRDMGRGCTPAAGVSTAFVTAQTRIAQPALGAGRALRFLADQRCFLKFGDNTVTATVAATSLPIVADRPEIITVPVGATHVSIIRQTTDGTAYLTPVA